MAMKQDIVTGDVVVTANLWKWWLAAILCMAVLVGFFWAKENMDIASTRRAFMFWPVCGLTLMLLVYSGWHAVGMGPRLTLKSDGFEIKSALGSTSYAWRDIGQFSERVQYAGRKDMEQVVIVFTQEGGRKEIKLPNPGMGHAELLALMNERRGGVSRKTSGDGADQPNVHAGARRWGPI